MVKLQQTLKELLVTRQTVLTCASNAALTSTLLGFASLAWTRRRGIPDPPIFHNGILRPPPPRNPSNDVHSSVGAPSHTRHRCQRPVFSQHARSFRG
jgi:hypothetical protein